MSSRSASSSSSARRGRRSATSTATSTSNEAQPVSDELAALISSTVREEIRRLSTAPPRTSSPAHQSASASSADLQSASASQVPPPPGCDDLLGPPMRLDLEAGPSTSPSTSQSAALPSVPTKLGQRILRGAVSTASLCRPGAYPTSGHPNPTGRGRLSPAVQYYCMHALAPATRQLYAADQQHYTNFCRLHARPLGPATDTTLAEFVTYLADVVNLTPTSIKTYLSAVWSLHIDRSWPDPLQAAPLTQRVLSGVKRIHGMHSRLNRLPITGTVLDRLVSSLQAASWLPIIDRHMLTAACTLAFHGFLRCSEFTTGLSRSSIRVLSSPQSHIELRLLASKTDPFRRGATITIGASSGPAAQCRRWLATSTLHAGAATYQPTHHCSNSPPVRRSLVLSSPSISNGRSPRQVSRTPAGS